MKREIRISLAEILVDIAAIRAKRVHPEHAAALTRLAADVVSGQPTVFEKLMEIK